MIRRIALALVGLLAAMLLVGCTTQRLNPLALNRATAVPGLAMALHPASASETNTDLVEVTLYFRYLNEPMLASESRKLSVRRDQSVEYAMIQALLEGPSAGHSDLRRLLPTGTTLESVTSRDRTLFVTFDGGFLRDEVPDAWQENVDWRDEAPLLRKLTVQSIAASITERFSYTGIQILVHKQGEIQTNLRLDNAYFLTGAAGASDPVARDESVLLTPINTARILFTAWQQHDPERLYRYIAEADKPALSVFTETLMQALALETFTVSGGTVSQDGQSATLTVDLNTLNGSDRIATDRYPLHLVRDNGIWKIPYPRLLALIQR